VPIPVAARSMACDCGRSLAGIAGSIPAGGMDGCLLGNVVCCQVEVSATGLTHVLPTVKCLSVIEELRRGCLGPLRLSSRN